MSTGRHKHLSPTYSCSMASPEQAGRAVSPAARTHGGGAGPAAQGRGRDDGRPRGDDGGGPFDGDRAPRGPAAAWPDRQRRRDQRGSRPPGQPAGIQRVRRRDARRAGRHERHADCGHEPGRRRAAGTGRSTSTSAKAPRGCSSCSRSTSPPALRRSVPISAASMASASACPATWRSPARRRHGARSRSSTVCRLASSARCSSIAMSTSSPSASTGRHGRTPAYSSA